MTVDVEIRTINQTPGNHVLAGVTLTIDGVFVVKGVKLIEGRERIFVGMPGSRSPDGRMRNTCHPISRECRTTIEEAVIAAYHDALAARESEENPE